MLGRFEIRGGRRTTTAVTIAILAVLALPSTGRADTKDPAATKIRERTFVFKRVGDLELKAVVYRPHDDVVRPVVLWVHGGALILGNRFSIDRRVKQAFLDAGFIFVSIDYRLAPETKLAEIVADVEDAHAWLHASGGALFDADTRKVAVLGSSAGGYLTLTAGFRATPRPAALVSLWGYGDLVGPWYSEPSDFYRKRPLVAREDALEGMNGPPRVDGQKDREKRFRFYLYCRQNGLWPRLVGGHDPRQRLEAFVPYMPLRNVDTKYPPTLLIHGTGDTDVPYEQSALMAAELERRSIPHRLVTVREAGHGLAGGDPELVADAYATIVPFVRERLGSPEEDAER